MTTFRISLCIVVCLALVSTLLDSARADALNDEQKDLVRDIAVNAGGVLQQLIKTRGEVRAAEAQPQVAATAALAAAQPQFPTGSAGFVPPNLVPINPQGQAPIPPPFQPPFQPQLQAPQFRQPLPPQFAPPPFAPPPFVPPPFAPQGIPQQGAPQQINPVGIPSNPVVPPANVPLQAGVGGDPCSATDTSPQAVERCLNAVRTNPNAFLGQLPCSIPEQLIPRRALRSDFTLTLAAAAHAQDLARMGTVGHTGSDGSDVRIRVQDRAGFPNASVGENAAGGQHSAREVVFDWMCSASHRKNVMSCNYDSFGTGVVPGGWPYWVQNFGCRSGTCTC